MMLNESLFEHTVAQYFVCLKVGGLGSRRFFLSHKSLCITSASFVCFKEPSCRSMDPWKRPLQM